MSIETITKPIATQRLIIRPFVEDDWQAVAAYTTDPAVMAFMEEGVQTDEQTKDFVRQNATGQEVTAYALSLNEAQTLIGHMVFHPWFAPRTYEIGWVLHPAYYRRGYASEAASALLRYGFDVMKLHRIIATCQPENPASYGVMEKIGMRREGHFRQCIYRGIHQDQEIWWDEYFYALLVKEWHERNA